MAYKIFGAVCIGSMETELCVYEIREGKKLKLLERASKLLPLGRDTLLNGRLSYNSVQQLCDILKDFGGILKSYSADDYRAYATMALRDASNSGIVLDQIKVRTGMNVEIISNSEQRYISYKALAAHGKLFTGVIHTGTLIMDSGYGSLQLSVFDRDVLVSTENLPIGAVKLGTIFEKASLTDEQLYQRSREIIDTELLNYRKLYLKGQDIHTLVGTGENILYRYWNRLRPELINRELSAEQVLNACHELRMQGIHTLEENTGIGRSYAKILFVTAVYIERIIEITGIDSLYFPGSRLCDGIALHYGSKKKLIEVEHDFEQDIISESRNMAKRYRCSTKHAERVEAYSLQIFDALRKMSGLTSRDRLLLQIAAILSNCGKFISIKNADSCSYYIIMSTEIIGLSHAERKQIAACVKFRNQLFDEEEAALDADPIRTAKMTAILKLASALDRSHSSKMNKTEIKVNEHDKELRISASYDGDLTVERISIEESSEFFEEIFGLRPVLKQNRKLV